MNVLTRTSNTLWRFAHALRVRKLHALDDDAYLQAYAANTDQRVRRDPKQAIGGFWEEMGALQFDFLREQGLEPHHALLDIGCGTLRAGRLLIRYLQPGRYTGFDISAEAISHGQALVADKGLSDRQPVLIHNPSGALDFKYLDGTFDFVLAQSVFTHLRPPMIEQCISNAHKIMRPGSVFYFTFFADRKFSGTTFHYDQSWFEAMAARYGFALAEHPDYDRRHPRGQRMLSLRLP